MFKRTKTFLRSGIPQPHIDVRFQYFSHYWDVAGDQENDIFFDEVRMESHRSLVDKINYQLDHNFDRSFDKFRYLFLNNPIFGTTNIIAKDASIQNFKSNIVALSPSGNAYKSNKIQVTAEFKNLATALMQGYKIKLLKSLYKVLSTNKPISDDVKADIRFLVNAFIVELYHSGYSIKYILELPDILFFESVLHKFPYKKTLKGFKNDKEKYEAYKNEEQSKMNLYKQLYGLITLIERPVKKGYYVFKVSHISLLEPDTINIGDVTFYNPQVKSRINLDGATDFYKKVLKEAENFHTQMDDQDDNSRASKCNAMVMLDYRTHEDIESKSGFYQAFSKVSQALAILNNIINRRGESFRGMGILNIYDSFKVHSDKTIARFGFDILHERNFPVNISDGLQIERLKPMQRILNKINTQTWFGATLFQICSVQNKLENREELFNFKDLWIPWESLMTKEELEETLFNCMYIDYKHSYLARLKDYLGFHLQESPLYSKKYFWVLDNEELKKLELATNPGKVIHTKRFVKKYNNITTKVDIEIIKDVIHRIDKFINRPLDFEEDLKRWVHDTVFEVYMERNAEVHSNILSDLSKVKLKRNFLSMSQSLFFYIVKFSYDNRTEDISTIRMHISNFKSTL